MKKPVFMCFLLQRNLQENSKSRKKASKKQPTMSLDEFTSLNVLKSAYPLETPTTPVPLDPHTLLNGRVTAF